MRQWLPQSCPQTAFSFHHISSMLSVGGGSSGLEDLEPEVEDADDTFTSQKPKKKSVYVRKQFPETWLWTEEMVK